MSKGLPDPALRASTLVELVRHRALQRPERRVHTFLIDGEEEGASLTCAALDGQARAIGALLQSYRIGGERVLLFYPAGLDFVTAFFGCLYSGAIAVPAGSHDPDRPNRTLSRLRAIAIDAQPVLALTTSAILATITDLLMEAPELLRIRWLATDKVSADLKEEWWDPGISGDTLAYLQYTSGSTTTPKGVIVSHGNVLQNSAYIADAWGYAPDSLAVMWVPHFHDDGLVHGIIQPLYKGFQSFFMSPVAFVQQPIRWLRAISRYQATHSGGPNFAYVLCVRKVAPEQRATLVLSSWRVAYNAAEPIRKETLEQFVGAFEPCGFRWNSFYPAYGLAEATLLVSTRHKMSEPVFLTVQAAALEEKNQIVEAAENHQRVRTLVGCGPAVGETKIVIARPGSLTRCLPNEVGEILVSNPSVARGYWNQAEEAERTFQAYLADTGDGPFLRTGDVGFLKDGELFVTGRFKDLIIIRGQNYYPQDIEWTVEGSHPSLRPGCCAAFSIDVAAEERLVVVAELQRHYLPKPRPPDSPLNLGSRPRSALAIEEVVAVIRQAVSEQHSLHVYAVLLLEPGTIPKTSSGKIQRQACRVAFLAGTLSAVGSVMDEGEAGE